VELNRKPRRNGSANDGEKHVHTASVTDVRDRASARGNANDVLCAQYNTDGDAIDTSSISESLPERSVAVVLGTRPEIIKLAGIVELLGPAAWVIHTGQHYDDDMTRIFFEEFGMRRPDVHIQIGGATRGAQIGAATTMLDELFGELRPQCVIVQGDTNTVAAGSLAANARAIRLVHVEAGLRSNDRTMPEEHNRIIADHLADLCLAPTDIAVENLAAENIDEKRVRKTGNTIVEAVHRLMPEATDRRSITAAHGVRPGQFALATFHRPENVDDAEVLDEILQQLGNLPIPVVLPLHPRTRQRLDDYGFVPNMDNIIIVSPVGYSEFLALGAESAFVISDSGGVQEEVSVYKRPLIVVRRSTERPEVIGTFAQLVPPGPAISQIAVDWMDDLSAVHETLGTLESPYGDDGAPRRSVESMIDMLGR